MADVIVTIPKRQRNESICPHCRQPLRTIRDVLLEDESAELAGIWQEARELMWGIKYSDTAPCPCQAGDAVRPEQGVLIL